MLVHGRSFNSFRVKKKSWSTASDVNHLHFRDSARHSVSVTAAIGHALQGKVCWQLNKKSTQVEYQAFVKYAKQQVSPNVAKPIWLYDGASHHCTKKSEALVGQLFYPLQNTAYASDFNAIGKCGSFTFLVRRVIKFFCHPETLWSVAKSRFDKLLLLHPEPLTEAKFLELVNLSISSIPS